MVTRRDSTVLVVDDHTLVRLGLVRAFEQAHDFKVAGQAASVQEAVGLAAKLTPAVVVTDIRLPDGSGLDLVKLLREKYPHIGVVVLTMYAGDDYLFRALEAGASAFVSKEAPAEQVIGAARQAVVAPLSFAAPDLVAAMQRRATEEPVRLSVREKEVLQLLAEGLGTSAIARRLFVSESTAKTHIGRIYEKLGSANRAQAIMSAVKAGLLESN